ncbi:adhesion G protein-coupled receptor B2 [Trichonephila clavipes]|nr:adhesion G protein-coupled receptor B2 [Trichonephila clavipes]
MAPMALFQHDNIQPYTARVSEDCLRTVTTLPWPARSPYLSPIEHIWDHLGRFTPNAAVLFVDVAIQPEVRFIAKQNSLMKIGNNGNLVLGPFDESTPCLMIVLMNCQTKLRINHLTAVKSVAILEKSTKSKEYVGRPTETRYENSGRSTLDTPP